MKQNLLRSHLANTHHLITRVSSALSLDSSNNIWTQKHNDDFLSISISSSKFKWLEVLIRSFVTDFRINSNLLSLYHSNLLQYPAVYAELICFCNLPNSQSLELLNILLNIDSLRPTIQLRISYVIQCYKDALFTTSEFIDHLEIPPQRVKHLAKLPFCNSYGPHA